jgi:hypothetical protein
LDLRKRAATFDTISVTQFGREQEKPLRDCLVAWNCVVHLGILMPNHIPNRTRSRVRLERKFQTSCAGRAVENRTGAENSPRNLLKL